VFKGVIKKRAYEDIVKQVRCLIEKGKLKRDDQLPSERELSETFRVSRATVREAIIALEAMMLVDRRQGNGTYVIASSEEALVQPLAAALFHEKDDLIDIFFVRKVLEPGIAQLAAEKANASEIEELEEIVRDQAEKVAEGVDPFLNDARFHHLLARIARNRVLERLFLAIVDLLSQTRAKNVQTEDRKLKSLHGHRNIVEAIKSGDGVTARKAMRRHLEEVEGSLFPKKKGGGKKRGLPAAEK
jgi:GntR family transcriptional regulator, transcriptional repressor for pyruvate dehydrogenase complex